MVTISDNYIITMDRGDYLKAPVFLNVNNALSPIRYILQEGDKLLFSVSLPGRKSDFKLIKKEYTKADLNEFGDVEIELEGMDTINMIPGAYCYQIKLLTKVNNIDYIDTVVPARKLVLL